MATSVTQHGITINFDADYTVGQYVNGDYYVVAPSGLDIDSTSPAQSTGRNGIMVNPSTQSQGFDDRADGYSSSLNVTLPYTASVGDSIIVSTSDGEFVGTPDKDYDTLNRSYIETVAILTVVSSAPASSFRPPYSGTVRTSYLESEVDLSLLPDLSSASVTDIPTLSEQVRRFERVQLDFIYNPAGQGIRPKQHMASYGGQMGRALGEAISRLALDDGTVALEPLAYGVIQYGIDLFGAMTNGNTSWPVNGGHDHARKPAMVLAAVLLDNTTMKDQIKAWANTENPDNDDLLQDDWSWRYSPIAKTPLYGDDGTEEDYWDNQLTQSGNKAIKDPYGYIDGGESSAGPYDPIVSPPSLAWSVMGYHLDGFEEVWNHPSLDRGNRQQNFGTFTLPDPYQSDGEGVLDGVGRYTSKHGVKNFNSTYDSDFTQSVYDNHVGQTVFMPDISPYGTKEANQVECSLEAFSRQDLDDYPDYWDPYDTAMPPEFQPGDYPYLTGTTIRYTTDGSEPTASSTLYSGSFTLDYTDADSDDYVTVKAKAFKASYEDSVTNTAWIRLRRFIRQGAARNSGSSSVTERTATFNNPVQEGSIIVAVSSLRNRSTTITFNGDGWNYIEQRTSSPSVSIAYKIADGGEQTVLATHSASSQRMAIAAYEISGVAGVRETISNTSEVGSSISKSSGTGAEVSNGTYPCIALWGGDDNGTAIGTEYSYSNSFEEIDDGFTSPPDDNRARCFAAFKTITATETPESTVTVDSANFRAIGALIVFNESIATINRSSGGEAALL